MTDSEFRACLRALNERRKALQMSEEALARRSGLSRVTVSRLLAGRHPKASFVHIAALAEALGVHIEFQAVETTEFVQEQARHQAGRLVGMMQGTMALESQAVSPEFAQQLEADAAGRLLNGPWKKLWVE
jgi:transcriptional regulator with XRE-family HTH domain